MSDFRCWEFSTISPNSEGEIRNSDGSFSARISVRFKKGRCLIHTEHTRRQYRPLGSMCISLRLCTRLKLKSKLKTLPKTSTQSISTKKRFEQFEPLSSVNLYFIPYIFLSCSTNTKGVLCCSTRFIVYSGPGFLYLAVNRQGTISRFLLWVSVTMWNRVVPQDLPGERSKELPGFHFTQEKLHS